MLVTECEMYGALNLKSYAYTLQMILVSTHDFSFFMGAIVVHIYMSGVNPFHIKQLVYCKLLVLLDLLYNCLFNYILPFLNLLRCSRMNVFWGWGVSDGREGNMDLFVLEAFPQHCDLVVQVQRNERLEPWYSWYYGNMEPLD